MKKNRLKIMFDIVLLILLILMYQKQVISLTFHEVGGLALLGFFVVHILLNYRWVAAVTKKLFSKSIPFKTRFGYLINAFLLISFVLIGLSGIMISKQLFAMHGGGVFKTMHYSASAFAIILIGIHLALHWRYITGIIKKSVPVSTKIAKPLGCLLAVVIFVFGSYYMTNTAFLRWLSMPFLAQQNSMEAHEGMPDGLQVFWGESSTAKGNEAADSSEQSMQNSQNITTAPAGVNNKSPEQRSKRKASGSRDSKDMQESAGQPAHDMGAQGFSIARIFSVIVQYGSIAGAIAVAAYMLEKLARFIRRKRERMLLS